MNVLWRIQTVIIAVVLVLVVNNNNKTTPFRMEEIKMPHKPQTCLFVILWGTPVIL